MSRRFWVDDVFRPLAVGGMMGCIAHSLVRLVQLFFPSWSGTYMVIACVLAAVEANYSYRLVRSRRLGGWDLLRFRAVEIGLFLILLRLGSYIGDPWTEVLRDVRAWPGEPARIFDIEVIYAFILVLLSWSTSTQTTFDLERIGEPPVKDKYYVHPVDALVTRFFWGGAALLCVAGLTRVGISSLLNLTRPAVPGIILNVLVYYGLGLVMLGQMQFDRLSSRWRKEGLKVPSTLASHWIRYTLILLGLAGLVAFLLPTAYTLPLLDVAAIVVQAIFYAFNVIFQLFLLAFLLLLTPLARLLGGEIRDQAPEPVPPPDFRHVAPDGSGPVWLEVLKSIAFWAFALGVVGYIVRNYLRDRPELTGALGQLKVCQSVRRLLRIVWNRLAHFVGAAADRIPAQLRRLQRREKDEGPTVRAEPFRFFRLGARSRRERMLYYYLSILRRAARHGYPRSQSQTPYEYDADLSPEVPRVEAELDRLTDAFVEARYSEHDVDDQREQHVRADWRRIRTALRSLGRQTGREQESDPEESD